MNKKKMKKYFMKGTDDVLEFGDMIELDLTKDLPNGKVNHHHFECKFLPELVDLLLEEEVIEEVEVDNEEPTDTENSCPMMDELVKANQNLEHRVYDLEKEVKELKIIILNLKPHKNAKKSA